MTIITGNDGTIRHACTEMEKADNLTSIMWEKKINREGKIIEKWELFIDYGWVCINFCPYCGEKLEV